MQKQYTLPCSLFVVLAVLYGTLPASAAGDSISVFKIDFVYEPGTANAPERDYRFNTIADYGGASLYYTDSFYRLIYASDYWELGDYLTNKRYTVYGERAAEGLPPDQQIPETYTLPGEDATAILFADDYDMENDTSIKKVAGIDGSATYFRPKTRDITDRFEVITASHYPAIPWHPFSFLIHVPRAFLALYKTSADQKWREGIKAIRLEQVNVPSDFFRLPPGMPVASPLAPPIIER